MIQFGQPSALYGLAAALILLSGWAWWSDRRSRRLLESFALGHMADRLTTSFSRPRQRLKTVLSLLACLFLIFALSRPQWGSVTEEIELKGVDILFALDTSRSMLAEDYQPNRLQQAKLAILDLVSRLEGDRVGLIAFAGDAFLQSPLTLDYSAFLQTLEAITTGTIPRGGTDVAGAIEEAMAYFEETDHHRVLVLISDGEDLEASGIQRARDAAAEGIAIFTVGVGSAEGELIPLRGPGGEIDYLRDHTGDPVRTRLDEQSLQAIADAGNGIYRPLARGAGALDEVYASARATVDEASMGSLTREVPIERYQWPLGFGLICLVLEWAIGTRRRGKNHFVATDVRRWAVGGRDASRGPPPHVGGFLFFAALTLWSLSFSPESAFASPREAERMYEAGNYERAIALWSEAAEEKPEDPRLHYNLGNAFYRNGQFAAAIAAYEKALPLADVNLQERVFYNLGNAQFQLGAQQKDESPATTTELWEESLQNYDNSLALNPQAEDASRNRAWVEQQFSVHGSRITVAPAPAEGGTTSRGGLFLPGTILELKAEAGPGWRFVSWQGAEVAEAEAPETDMIVQQSAEVLAVFVETRELEVNSADPLKGTAETSGRYDLDQEVPIEAKAKDYFAFKTWTSDSLQIADPQAAQTTVKLSDNGSVTATFTDAYHLEVNSEPALAGNVGNTGFFERNTQVPIQAEARDGFEWLGWSGEHIADIGDHNAPQTEIALNGDRKAVAQFERVWNLVVLPDRDEAGSTTGGGNFPVGSEQPIEATPNEGYTFQRWEGPGVEDPGSAATTVEVLPGHHDVIAIFEQEDGEDENEDSSDSEEQQEDSESESSDDESSDPDESNPEKEEDAPPEEEPSESETEERSSEEEQPPQEETSRETPDSLTEEEARQLLQMLRQDERQLPLRLRPPGEDESTTGRDW